MSPETGRRRSVLAGVDVGGTKVKIGLTDVDAGLLDVAEIASGPDTHTATLLASVHDELERLRLRAEQRLGAPIEIVGAGLVTPGVVSDAGIALAPNNPGMGALQLHELTAAIGVARVGWANDVKAAALAEHAWGGLVGARSGLYVNLGTGLSAGAVIDGRPLNGAHGGALEIGYLLPASELGPGHRSGAAPLEDRMSGRAMRERAVQHGLGPMTASAILQAAAHDDADPAVRALADDFVDQLTRAVVNLSITLDADAVCIGGGIASATDAFLGPLRTMLDEYVPYPPRLAIAERPDDSSLFGAIRIACDEAGLAPARVRNPYDGAAPALPTDPDRTD